MRLAIIDLGTNSVRFDIHQLGPGKRVARLHREKLMIRLGQGVFLDGKLDEEAIRRTLQALQSYHQRAQSFRATKIIAFGTSALRETSDSERLIDLIRKQTGIEVKVITGEEEARLIALGILANERQAKGKVALVDIGGGSTEITISQSRRIERTESFALGTARLQQLFLKRSPPKPDYVERLRTHIRTVLLPRIFGDGWPRVEKIIGSSGTIRTVSKLIEEATGNPHIGRKDLSSLVARMTAMTTSQLLGLPGMDAKRVDMILAGTILLEECMLALRAKKIVPTSFSLRDGILVEELELVKQRESSHIPLHLPELYAKAVQFGGTEARLKRCVSNAELLFVSLRKLHRLPHTWHAYLTAATILRDVGEGVAVRKHEEHSFYIVKNADFASMEAWESDFVAHLCLHHENGKLAGLPSSKQDPKGQVFLKLLSLLRIVDALDDGPEDTVKIDGVRTRGRLITLTYRPGGPSSGLEVLHFDRKKKLFEEIFKRQIRLTPRK